MRSKPARSEKSQRTFLMPTLREQLDARQPIYRLAERMPWGEFEEAFGGLYSEEGRPAKPIRLMVSLLLLKQMFNLGDETVVAGWVQNPYWQFLSGCEEFQWELPCDPSDLVYFRQRIGDTGAQLLLSVSARMHGRKAREETVVVDTTVQEKNVTHPVDSKLHRRIVEHCWRLAQRENVALRRSYRRTFKGLVWQLRPGTTREGARRARRAARRLKVIAGRLVRELTRKLPAATAEAYAARLALYRRVLGQKRRDKNKIYSLHEPGVLCLAKGKVHKKYEFGNKVALAVTAQSGIFVAAESFAENLYDGHTLPAVLDQIEANLGQRPKEILADRGFRGAAHLTGETKLIIPQAPPKPATAKERALRRRQHARRVSIEPRIGHLKASCRLGRNFLKGTQGDSFNALLAAAAANLRLWLRVPISFCLWLLRQLSLQPSLQPRLA